jgi:protein TonB
MAKRAGVQGDVVLRAVIAKDGTVQDVRIVSGNPMLADAAVQAVRQWRYQPSSLDGQPVEAETLVQVKFKR